MKKIYKKTSLFSRIVNLSFLFTGDKKNSSTIEAAKKYMEKLSKIKDYNLPEKMNLKKEEFNDMPVYSHNNIKAKESKRKIIYIHGGTFIEQARYFQIKFAMNISEKTDAKLIFPVYPLLPGSNCKDMYKLMDRLYEKMVNDDDEVILLGDSAGGGFILSFAMYLRDNNKKMPKHVIMLSPWLDISLSNPDIYKAEKKDYMCGVDGTRYIGSLWADDIDVKDPLVSPMFGDLNNLPEMTIITGKDEFLNSDCRQFSEKLSELNIKHNFIEYENQGHDFGAFPTKEGHMVVDDIASIINRIEVVK